MTTTMLERAIEIEGLIRILRDGEPSPETYDLLKRKTTELAEIAGKLPELAVKTKAIASEIFSPEDKPSEDNFFSPEDKPFEDKFFSPKDKPSEDKFFSPEDKPSEDKFFSPVDKPSEDKFFSPEDKPSEDISIKDISAEGTVADDGGDDIDDIFISTDIEDEEEPASHTSTAEAHPASGLSAKQRVLSTGKNLKSAFSLNDRYLFSRELFDGNMKMFDATLDFLDGIENFADIEDYFYNELEWDPDNSNVAAFLEILRPNFKE